MHDHDTKDSSVMSMHFLIYCSGIMLVDQHSFIYLNHYTINVTALTNFSAIASKTLYSYSLSINLIL